MVHRERRETTLADRRKPPHSGADVLIFLDHHRLAHTPEHYSFAHEYLSGQNDTLCGGVDNAIDGGVRLTEDQVRKLRPTGVPHRLVPDLDHLTLRILDIVSDATTVTGDFNRDLIAASARLLDDPHGNIEPLIATMLKRAEDAEASLAQAARHARDIRTELAALQTEGQHDALTSLPNRAALETRLATLQGARACLAILDIDHLRRINDGHSPAVGDRLLKVVARTLADVCHEHLVTRWDGGAFAILLEQTDLRSAGEILARACEAVSARDMRVRESGEPLGRISVSVGVVALRGREVDAILEAATDQLRCAKQLGRNRVSVEGTVIGISTAD